MGEHIGNLGNIIGRLSEHVGKCMGNMVPTSKSKKNELWTPPLPNTPKGKIIIIIIIIVTNGPSWVHLESCLIGCMKILFLKPFLSVFLGLG
jgi:hypothetical protein